MGVRGWFCLAKFVAASAETKFERSRGNLSQAIQLLESARRFDLGTVAGFRNNYTRGLTYLDQRAGKEAAGEFQKILDNPSRDLFSQLYPLAHLGLARASVINGDPARARKAYQDFFALWKDADPDIPILQQARTEYEQLK